MQSELRKVRNFEKDFLSKELINDKFYIEKSSPYQDSISYSLLKIEQRLEQIFAQEQVDKHTMLFQLRQYEKTIDQIGSLCLQRGFKDYGLVGSLREAIHEVEGSTFAYDRADMLMLRRHEKDFLLRKDRKYQDKFNQQLNEFIQDIESKPSSVKKQQILTAVHQYGRLFNDLVSMEKRIGLGNQDGMTRQLHSQANALESAVALFYSELEEQILAEKSWMMQLLLGLLVFQLILGILLVILLSRKATRLSVNFAQIKDRLNTLSQGKLPDFFSEYKSDEIGRTKEALNLLIAGMHRYAEFACQIGEGKLEVEFERLSQEDRLGNSLLEMRDKLTVMVHDEQKRSWANEGVSAMEVIIRNFEDGDDFYVSIISELVKYLDINQGGLFVKSRGDGTAKMVLKGSYAWGRRKFRKDSFFIDEGLIGQAWREKESIYLTEVPENFISITSGLGDANPTALLIVPLVYNEEVVGIIELASFKLMQEYEIEMVERVAKSIAATITKVRNATETRRLFEASQQQSEELRAQEEELRQNMEEMQAIQEEQRRKEAEYINVIETLKKEKHNLIN